LISRKSLIAAKDIRKGEQFTEENIIIKRPGTGISPMEYWDMIREVAQSNFAKDTAIEK
jgi:sialic acid synthase SpsE